MDTNIWICPPPNYRSSGAPVDIVTDFKSGNLLWNKLKMEQEYPIKDLKIDVYGKRLTSDPLFAIKTKSLTVKCFTYRIYSKYRKLNTQRHFNHRNMAVDIKWFSAHIAWRLTSAVSRLHFKTGQLDKLTAIHYKRRTSTWTSRDGCPMLLPISDNVSVVIQGVLVQHFRFF